MLSCGLGKAGRLFLAISVVVAVLLCGCTDMKYTTHLESSLKEAKIPASTIAVFPITELNYQPPHSCMGSGIAPESEEKYRQNWNKTMSQSLHEEFPKHKFVFLQKGAGVLSSSGVDFFGILEQSKRAARAEEINAMASDSTVYEPMITSNEMKSYLKPVADSTGAQYALVFVSPSLSGDIHTSYMANGMNGGTFNSSTVYTADVQVLAWECSSGRLLFSSGGWGSGSSSCFLFVPQDMAIDNANEKFRKNLQHMLLRLIKYDESKRYASSL
jgi:hypothetical protein